MAKITLELESNALGTLNQAVNKMDELRNGVGQFGDEGKAAFTKTTAGVISMNMEVVKVQKQFSTLPDEIKKGEKGIIAIGKETKKLKDELKGTDDQAVKAGKKIVEDIGKKGEKAIVSLKAQLAALKRQLQETSDPKEMERLTAEAGQLQDAIEDANTAVNIFASGSKFEILSKSFGNVGQKILALDFAGAVEGSRHLLQATKALTFKDALTGIKQLGQTILNIGKALLTNPLFLIGATIALVIANFDKLKEAFTGQIAKMNALTKAYEDQKRASELLVGQYERELKIAEAQGLADEKILAIKEKLLFAKIDEAKASIKLNAAKILDVKANDSLYESYVRASIGVYKFIGAQDQVLLAELALAKNKKERNKENLDAQFEAEQNLLNLVNDLNVSRIQQGVKSNKEYNDKLLQARKDLESALADLRKKAEEADLAALEGKAKLDKVKEINLKEIALMKERILTVGLLTDKNFKITLEQQAQFAVLEAKAKREYNEGIIKLEADKAVRIAEERRKDLASELEFLGLKAKLQEAAINALTAP
ncbi:MAG: hypothetical protein M3R27_14895, partial [Bacteroidota bacterium]|nr:hypothetical protein [Bacteroidota bacterium]